MLQSAVIVIDSAESLEDALELVTLLRVCALDPPSPEARIPLLQSRVSGPAAAERDLVPCLALALQSEELLLDEVQ